VTYATVVALDPARRAEHATAPGRVRVVVADGQTLVRSGYRVLLEGKLGIQVVGEAATGEQAVTQSARLRPDVVLLDASLAGLDAVEATRTIASDDGPAVLVLIGNASEERVIAALRAGATSVLAKDTDPDELVDAVRVVARGGAFLSPIFTRRLIAELSAQPEPVLPSSDLVEDLTPREREVVELVAHGLSNDQIAERLVVTRSTAKTHVSRAMVKLNARDRAQVVVFAYENGLAIPRAETRFACAIA
jgi:DNA-binding NarL/FixJ family response regulator